MTRDEIITEIRKVQNELESLGASRERLVLGQFKDAELLDVLESLREQLARRKEFLGEKL